jgi:uncharacterized membrane protein
MKNLFTIGRILFALPFGIVGLNHFLMKDTFLEIMQKTSFIPDSGFMILFTGLVLIVASISIMLNKFIQITCLSLAGLLLIFILTIHIPGLFAEATMPMALFMLLKDMGLMGGALMIAAYYHDKN